MGFSHRFPAELYPHLFSFILPSWCHSDKSKYALVHSSWSTMLQRLLHTSSCKFRIISYNLRRYFPYCRRHRFLLLPCGSIYTRFPKKMQAIYLDTIRRNLKHKSYHFYSYAEVSKALQFFSQFQHFREMFSHVCCSYSGITMNHAYV